MKTISKINKNIDKIVNKTSKRVLANKVQIATGFWQKTLGLMFRSKIDDSAGFLMEFGIEGEYGIWMLGMRFGIDLVFIDSKKTVVGVFENLKPVSFNPVTWRVYKPSKPAKWVLELPAGTIGKTKTSKGDKLSFQ
jgi:uncharacterized membrane protein (UPF0127 family)